MAFLFDRISAFITDTLIEGKIIKIEERNLYLYCFGTLIEMTANLITTLIIGALLGKIVAALFFMLVFISLRSTAGGYHCETAGKCYLLSMAVYLAVILTYDYVSIAPSYGDNRRYNSVYAELVYVRHCIYNCCTLRSDRLCIQQAAEKHQPQGYGG